MLSEAEIAHLMYSMMFMRMEVACWDGTVMLWYSFENFRNPFDHGRFVRFEFPTRSTHTGPCFLTANVGFADPMIRRTRFETFGEAFEYAMLQGVITPRVDFAEIEAYFKLGRILEHVEDESDPEIEDIIKQLEPRVDVARRSPSC